MKPARKSPAKAPTRAPAKSVKPKATPRATPRKTQQTASEPIEDEIPSHPPEPEMIDEPIPPPQEFDPEPVSSAPPPAPPPPEEDLLAAGDPAKTLGFIESLIGTLTFRTVALVALLTAIGLTLFALYENRTSIVNNFTKPDAPISTPVATVGEWTLSESSKQSLIALTKATAVRMIILSDVDLKKNRRVARYYFIEDPSIVLPPSALQALALPLPVFDYDAKNTEQMIAILSNDFRCDPYIDTIYNRFAPGLANEFQTVCRMAVPPFVGTFVGFISVGVAANTTPTELETIRLEVSRIAVEIYMNDVAKKLAPATK